ncbi:MAG: hypothetical protein ACFB0E_22615 [Leptolyngbyaceae cyanobacterium]
MVTPTALVSSEVSDPDANVLVSVEIRQKLGNYPKVNKDPVRLLVIGSRPAIQSIVQQLHLYGFAEIFEWTDFMPAPTPERPLRCQPGESMKMLVKYFARS